VSPVVFRLIPAESFWLEVNISTFMLCSRSVLTCGIDYYSKWRASFREIAWPTTKTT
jgi:hypothetical protein